MSRIEITEDVIAAASDYMSYAEKTLFVGETAVRCFERMEMRGSFGDGVPLPPMYKENAFLKSRALMTALAKRYLKMPFTEEEDGLMSLDDYELWAGSHVLNQLERLKSRGGAEIKNKVFDILSDWHDLEKKLNTEIYGMLQAMNDPVTRLTEALLTKITPKDMQELSDSLNSVMTQIAQYKSGKAAEK